MPRLFLPTTQIINNQISITGEKARYLVSVLRCGKGDDLLILDGAGNCLETSIISSGKKEVVAEVRGKIQCDLESPLNIVLAQGLLKGEKMDLVIQKATELGVKEVMPIVTVRSQMRETKKIARWRKIAEEASRQSGRSVVPVVHEPVPFEKSFAACGPLAPPHGCLFYEESERSISEAFASFVPHPSNFLIVVGPEGGFTRKEVDLAQEKGILVASLGRRILRAETAAISAITLVQFLLGDMG